jgi:hypothetical protein
MKTRLQSVVVVVASAAVRTTSFAQPSGVVWFTCGRDWAEELKARVPAK